MKKEYQMIHQREYDIISDSDSVPKGWENWTGGF